MSRKVAVRSLLGFIIVYGLLIVPWPGFDRAYARYFQGLGRLFFTHDLVRITRFELNPETGPRALSTLIKLSSRDQLDIYGRGPVKILGLDTRGVAWLPTALIIALTIATPVSRQRRAYALFWGLVLVHALILFAVAVYIWNESAYLGTSVVGPIRKYVLDGLEETLVTQLGPSFALPLLIWIVVIFRREDFQTGGFLNGKRL